MDQSLAGKSIVVTGATSGIGFALAEALVQKGAHVIGVGRSQERCAEAERRLQSLANGGRAEYCLYDLSSQVQVRLLAEDIQARLAKAGKSWLDGLINNAGTFTYWLTLTQEGFEKQWAVNHLAPFLLTHELLPLLLAAPQARVVTVSSGSHYHTRLHWDDLQLIRHYNGLLAYNQSKLANVLFTFELNRRLGPGSTVKAFAADPGLVKTEIGAKGNPGLVRWIWGLRQSGGVPAEASAQGLVFLIEEPSLSKANEIYWKNGRPKAPSREALDPDSARRLWAVSMKMCGIPEESPATVSVRQAENGPASLSL